MKALPTLLIFSALLVAVTGCGKKNESGRNNGVCLQYNVNGQCSSFSSNSYTSGNNVNLNGILSQIPCESQYGYGNVSRSQQNLQVQTATIAKRGQSYLGVTSMGDIAIVTGNGTTNAQMTVYICGGQMMGQVTGPVLLGEYTTPSCPITTITAATLGGMQPIFFRDPRFGRGMNRVPFSFCQ
jgi:hypothetical protein